MLTVRVLPSRGVPLRSALATVEITTALVAAHTVAGGTLPSTTWIAAMAAAVFGAGLVVLRGTVRPRVALPALVVVQLALHCWLMVLTPSGGHEMAGMGETSGAGLGGHLHVGWPMLAAHLAGAVVTAVVWELRSRAVDVLVGWSDHGVLPVPPVLAQRVPTRVPRPGLARVLVRTPLRGPPSAPRPA